MVAVAAALPAIGFFIAAPSARAATDTWIATSTGNWSAATNWSLGAAPTASDTALFSASSTQNATIDSALTVGGIDMASGYTGTITQGSGNAVTIGTSTASYGFSEASGTFDGSTSTDAITVNGPFSLTGGTFASTKGTLTFHSNASFSAGTFQNGSGLAVFDPTSSVPTVVGSALFNNLQIGNDSSVVSLIVATGTTLTVRGYLYILQSWGGFQLLGGGAIDEQGNIEASYAAAYATGTASIALTGTGNQLIGDDALGGRGSADSVSLPNISFEKSTGTVTLQGDIDIADNFINASGTAINPGTSTVIIGSMGFSGYSLPGPGSNATTNALLQGSSTFYNLSLSRGAFTIATGTTITVQGFFYPQTDNFTVQFFGGGQFDLQGNVEAAYAPVFATGTASIVLTGTGNQLIGDDAVSGNGTQDALVLPNLTINKATGTVTWGSSIGSIWFTGNFTNASATLISPGTSTAIFFGPAITLSGASTFNNLSLGYGVNAPFSGGPGANIPQNDITIATGTTITAQGFLWFNTNYTNISLPGGGTIDVWGNIEGGHYGQSTGTVSIVLDGTGGQLIDDNSSVGGPPTLDLPSLTVNKASGLAYMTSTPIVIGALDVAKGTLQLATSTSPLVSSLTVDGPLTVSASGTLSDYAPSTASSTVILGSSLVNDGTVSFSSGGPSCGNPVGIYLESATSGTPIPWSGTGSFLLQNLSLQDETTTLSLVAFNSTNAGDVATGFSFFSGCPVAPTISSFSASPSSITEGNSAALSWSIANASSVAISGSALSFVTSTLAGSESVTPTTTGSFIYTLTATSPYETSTATTSVTVNAVPAGGQGNGIDVDVGGGAGTYPTSSTSTAISGGSAPSASSTEDAAYLESEIASLESELQALISRACASGIVLPSGISCNAQPTGGTYAFTRDLSLWDRGSDVYVLQEYLIGQDAGPAARRLNANGATGMIGFLTYGALIEFQASHGIPPTGYFGPVTRGYVESHP